jgi:hypothetical protein
LVKSPVVVAVKFALLPVNIPAGGAVEKATVGAFADVTVTVALALTALSATEVTVMVTLAEIDGAV